MRNNHIKHILNSLLVRQEQDWRLYVVQNWTTIIGNLHTKMCLEKVVGDMLVIGVYDVHWMQELHLMSTMIIRTINAKLGDNRVSKLRFVLVQRRTAHKKSIPVQSNERNTKKIVFPQRCARVLTDIKNKDLHDALQKYFERCMQR